MAIRSIFSSRSGLIDAAGSVDLSGYSTTAQMNAALALKADKTGVYIRRPPTYPIIASGVYWKPPGAGNAASDYTSAATRTIWQPFYVPKGINLADFDMKIQSKAAVTSGQAMLALYALDESTGKPTTRLAVSGNLDMSALNNIGTLSLNGVTTPDDSWYCQAISCDSPVLTLQGQSTPWSIGCIWGTNAAGTEYVSYYGSRTYGTATLSNPAPDVPGSYTGGINAVMPMICFLKR